MLTKFSTLKDTLKNNEAKSLCESAIVTLSSTIYTNITPDAKFEIENTVTKNLFEGLSVYANEDANLKSWLDTEKRLYNIKNIGVRQAINNIIIKEGASHPTLKGVLEGWKSRLHNTPEIMLYEGFVNDMCRFNFIPSVSESVKFITENVSSYGNDISLTKMVEEMKNSNSSYLVPLIEDVINNYISNKNAQTKSFLKETLVKFSYDNYVKGILDIVTNDAVSLKLESANSNNVVSKIYSPIALMENGEVLFNVKGDFYIRKGNNINRVPAKEIKKLDENFVELCNILNNNSIEIFESHINIYKGKYKSVINESTVTINDKVYDKNAINEAVSAYKVGGSELFDIIDISQKVSESFDEIAELDFVKRVTSRVDEGCYADIFKLRDNVYITTADKANGKKTFYRGVNPIQARTIMMEHMSHDVSSVFENILPQYNKIVKDINNTKSEYVKYIEILESNISQFSNIDNAVAKEVYTELVNELNQVKEEYKDYLIEAEAYLRPADKMCEYANGVCEGFTITVRDDKTGATQTVAIPDTTQNPNPANQQVVGQQPLSNEIQQQDNTPSAVTYDDEQSQLMAPVSVKGEDNIELPVDVNDVEQEAEEAEEESEESITDEGGELEGAEDGEEETTKKKLTVKKEMEESFKGGLNESKYKKFNLKRKLNESADLRLNDKVTVKGRKGYITGQDLGGKYIVLMENGSTLTVEPSKAVLVDGGTRKNALSDRMIKFNEKTQQALMEQSVRCGIFYNNIPLRTTNCSVKFNEWYNASNDSYVTVLVEGRTELMTKKNVQIFEDVNNFANISNYVPAKVMNENELVNALVNILDLQNSIGDSSPVRIITVGGDNMETGFVPAKTISAVGEPFEEIPAPQEVIVLSDDNEPEGEEVKSFDVKFDETSVEESTESTKEEVKDSEEDSKESEKEEETDTEEETEKETEEESEKDDESEKEDETEDDEDVEATEDEEETEDK